MKILLACCLVCLPLRNLRLTSAYGYRIHPLTGKYKFHSGVDLKAGKDTVFAVMKGTVSSVSYNDFLGMNIRISHNDFESGYGHLSRVFVTPGETVAAGDPIAITGATGRVTGEHLHFFICYHRRNIDPLKFLIQILINQNHE